MRRLSTTLVAKAPAAVSACSAVVYFACSEGIRDHMTMLWNAVHAIMEHLR
ncbi:hypothetical protein FHS02_004603 [Massilia umbonata]|uniref:Uncharacterized protein n=1 Tax=Pseudoduganella umbonata TaxID=864828 RepID=A0A7W5HCN7_9BURK|nr:hypothetical protein [Pseudoduganella umbonata]